MATEQGLYAQVIMLSKKDLKITEAKKKTKINSSSMVSLQDHSVGLILILIGLRKFLANVNLISIGKYIKCTTKQTIQIHLKRLKLQWEVKMC